MKNLTAAILCLSAALPFTVLAQPETSDLRKGYIVTLKPGSAAVADVAPEVARRSGGQLGYVYEHVLGGFSIRVPAAALSGIERNPNVLSIEEDISVEAFNQTVPTGVTRSLANLDALEIDGVDDYRVDADVAVLDTGIDVDHPDLSVAGGTNCLYTSGGNPFQRSAYCEDSESGDDDHYHGTHVAGTVAALDNDIGVVGVAPGARLWAVKVLDSQGSGTLSGIIAGIDWVVARGDIEVINMSLGGSGSSDAMDQAVADAVAAGVTVVVAAGNSDADAAGFTPANAPDAITVSALADFDGQAGGLGSPTCRSDQDDTLADFSNWGAVDIAAPGVCILSTYPLELGSYSTISGTSMAAPHVAGAAAILASNGQGPLAIRDTLLSSGNFDWVDDSGDGIQEPLLDISSFTPTFVVDDGDDTPSNSAPVASMSVTCTDLSCTFDGSDSTDDGTISGYEWAFGDGNVAIGQTTHYTYNSAGSYTVTLTVTDDEGLTDSASEEVSVSEASDGITLSATGYKERGLQKVDLSWQGTTADEVDIRRDGAVIATVADTGSYTDNINQRGGGSYTYTVCEAGTATCSAEAQVIF